MLLRPGLRACALVLTMFATISSAAESTDQKTELAVAMSRPVYDGLQTAQAQIETKNYGKGHATLKALRALDDLSAYETAQIWNLTAYAYYQQENYKNAIGAYTRVLKQSKLPVALVQSTLKTLSQLYFTVEDYKRALIAVDHLIQALDSPSAEIYMLKGQAHFQLGQYKEAIAPIKTALEKDSAEGKIPAENSLLLLRVCYYELRDFDNMLVVLKDLIRRYPKDRYVLTLAAVYSELGDTQKQLALTEALYEEGKITDGRAIVNLANLYLLHNIPFKAASTLEREISDGRVQANERNLRLLSQAWYQAREDAKAIPPLIRAASLAGDGELYVRLAQSYINLERWQDAADAVASGLAKGGIERLDTANIMLGMALFNQHKYDQARAAFAQAGQDKRSAVAARQWLTYLDSELNRDDTLKQTVPQKAAGAEDVILKNL